MMETQNHGEALYAGLSQSWAKAAAILVTKADKQGIMPLELAARTRQAATDLCDNRGVELLYVKVYGSGACAVFHLQYKVVETGITTTQTIIHTVMIDELMGRAYFECPPMTLRHGNRALDRCANIVELRNSLECLEGMVLLGGHDTYKEHMQVSEAIHNEIDGLVLQSTTCPEYVLDLTQRAQVIEDALWAYNQSLLAEARRVC